VFWTIFALARLNADTCQFTLTAPSHRDSSNTSIEGFKVLDQQAPQIPSLSSQPSEDLLIRVKFPPDTERSFSTVATRHWAVYSISTGYSPLRDFLEHSDRAKARRYVRGSGR